MTAGDIDVVIAARNEAAQIGACLDALRAQDYPRALVRVFVCDDRSRDETCAIASARGATVVTSPAPGAAAARNAGIRAGGAPLVAFLDAHAVPAPTWLSALARALDDPRVGGCQSRLVNRATDPRVDRFVREAPAYADAAIAEQTVAGTRTLYPWLLTGNCLYRRAALEEAGGFDARLHACEDVDLGWRVVLAGYLLVAAADTEVVHVEGRPWGRFVTKGWRYGRGAAQVARAYALHGASPAASPAYVGGGVAETIAGFCYWCGYRWQRARQTIGSAAPTPRPLPSIRRGRDPFAWTPGTTLAIEPSIVYWFRGDTSIVVNPVKRQRLVLDNAGDMIWRLLIAAAGRDRVIETLIATYGIARQTAEADLDDVIDELVELGIVSRRQISLGP